MDLEFASPPARRHRTSMNCSSPEPLVIALLNFAQAGREGLGPSDELWSSENLHGRAAEWRSSRMHPNEVELPTDVQQLVIHHEFLRAHGVPLEMEYQPGSSEMFPDGCLPVVYSDFDRCYGEGAFQAIADHVFATGQTDTYAFRREWANGKPERNSAPSLPQSGSSSVWSDPLLEPIIGLVAMTVVIFGTVAAIAALMGKSWPF